MFPPAYAEVVERYGLETLKVPGDLVVKNGSIAITKSGNLMLNSVVYSALFRLVQRWRFSAPTLQTLFDAAFSARHHLETMNKRRDDAFSRRCFNSYHELNEEIGANELSSGTYAGGVVMVLARLLLAFKDDVGATDDDWKESAPLIEGCSVGLLLEATANNFRHNDEWAKTRRLNKKQLRSIRVLAAALKETIAPDGSGHRLSRDISPEILELLSGGCFDKLSFNLFAFAQNVVNRR